MFSHPKYLEIPWDVHWRQEKSKPRRPLWWSIGALILLALCLIGVGITNGLA